MLEALINETYMIEYPEGFHLMDDAEKAGYNVLVDGPFVGLSDPGRHIIVTIGWRKAGLASLLVSPSEAAASGEAKVRKAMVQYGYTSEGFIDRKIGGCDACGYAYNYTANGIAMHGETYVMKSDKTFYYFNIYARQELLNESLPVIGEMLDSVHKK